MAFETTITDGIAHLVLCKPPVNAFNSEEWVAIAAEIRSLGEQSSVRVIVVSAEGKGFCAGVDIKELGAEPAKIVPVNKGNFDTFEAIHRNPKPVVLAIHGFVLGGGIGMVQKVRHMYFTGEFIDAAEAFRLGAIEKVVPRAELVSTALEIAKSIAAKSPRMISLAKEALNAIEDGNLEEKYRREQGLTLEAYMHADSQEARDAFNEKRDADFND